MPTFEFTSPEGVKYSVDGPEGATAEQAFAVLQQQLGTPNNVVDPSIPRVDVTGHYVPDQQPAAPADPSLVDKIKGLGEAGLSTVTGGIGGTLGTLGGALGGLAGAVATGEFGTPQGMAKIEQAAGEGANALTYQPRTQLGQEYAQTAGEAINSALPVALMPELAAAGAGARAGANTVRETARNTAPALNATDAAAVAGGAGRLRDVVTAPKGSPEAPVVSQIRKVSPAIADRVQRTLERNADATPGTPTPGTRASVGAAGTDMATQRQQVADKVGVNLTLGQVTRDQNQLRFEQETAKGEQGAPLRERSSDQNEQVYKHFDNLVDQTGKETADLIGTGRSVDQALRDKVAQDKARIRTAYKEADKAGEMEAPVELQSLIDHLNESAPDAATAPILSTARARALQLGIASEDADGQLVALPTSLKNAERYRQAIGRATDFEPTNMRQSAMIKGAVDSATEGAGGDLYRAARRLRENFAKQYEDRGVVASLLNNKKGTADRKVALEDVFKHSILNASREQVAQVRRALTAHPKDAVPEIRAAGLQAWKDLQGETMNWIKEQAFANTATDQRGNVILSVPKLDRAIKRLDADRRLQTIFGTQGAQHLRDINDLAKVIYTTPPGTVNTSNTASVLLAALAEAGVTGSMTGLPVPVLSTLRVLSKQVKNRQLQKRIEIALTRGQVTSKNAKPASRPAGATLH